MGMGPSAVEREAQQYRQNFGNNVLPGYVNQSQGYINTGMNQLQGVNSQISNYMQGIGNDPGTMQMRNYLSSVLNSQGSDAAQGTATYGVANNLAQQGQTFAQRFGSDLGGLALQQRNMQTVADKLSSTSDNPFAQLTQGAREDAALQNNAGMDQLRNQLASQGLDSSSGIGAAALAALQGTTNKQVADAARQSAVQGAQFQQQGLQQAAGIYGQIGGLDLQRASTAGQLGLQGYQADISNAGRMDQMSMSNAQLGTNVSLANAASRNSLMQAAMQGQLGLVGNDSAQRLQALGLLSNNANSVLGAGQNMWGAAFNGQQNYMNNLNQMAQASAQGRGSMWGGLLQGGLGLAGTLLGGPLGGALGAGLGGMLGGRMGGNGGMGTMGIGGVGTNYQYSGPTAPMQMPGTYPRGPYGY